MEKLYPASAVANFFIKKNNADPSGDLTHLKLQKLLYYAQGWFLANYDRPLFEDNIEAWRYGPVVHSIYSRFRGSGDSPIQKPITAPFYSEGQVRLAEPEINPDDQVTVNFLNLFWDAFSKYDAWTLVNATHSEESPWYAISQSCNFHPHRAIIPIEMIEEYFKGLMPNRQ